MLIKEWKNEMRRENKKSLKYQQKNLIDIGKSFLNFLGRFKPISNFSHYKTGKFSK